jgi:hypothetical protein
VKIAALERPEFRPQIRGAQFSLGQFAFERSLFLALPE